MKDGWMDRLGNSSLKKDKGRAEKTFTQPSLRVLFILGATSEKETDGESRNR